MNTRDFTRTSLRAALLVLASVLAVAACGKKVPSAASTQPAFASPEEAVSAFVAALQSDDLPQLQRLLGPGAEDVVSSGDAVADKRDRDWFVAAYKAKHSLDADGPGKRTLNVGEDSWPMPIPIVQRDGKWYLDGAAGADELIYRRVGRNELGAIDVCRGFVNAQLDYAAQGHDGDPPGIYALKLISDAGTQNGLYWPTSDDEPPSPAGPFVAAAAAEGYRAAEGEARRPYHGYYYRLLYAQGSHASGGAKEYFRNGVMTEGFALIAWPADYGVSGVQTFIVNQDGVVFQKDLGEDTANAANAIKAFDPDSSWTAVAQAESPAA